MEKKYSINQVRKAGVLLLQLDVYKDTVKVSKIFNVLSYWRLTHEKPLSYVVDKLQKIVLNHDKTAIFAKRLKRHLSIGNKLIRYKSMKLNTIQDIGGCRIIVNNPKKVIKIVRDLKKWPEFRKKNNSLNMNDYILKPKDDGYRSIHLIGKFTDGTFDARNIEIQIRTGLQHDQIQL